MINICLNNVSYRYPDQPNRNAISNANLTLSQGVTLLMGANGTGKTTLLHLIATLLYPQTGEMEYSLVTEEDIFRLPNRGRKPSLMRHLFMLDDNPTPSMRTIKEARKLHAPLYPNFSSEMLESNLREFGIDERTPLQSMSLGELKRALFSYALSLQTDVLLLDEPVNGLDMGARDTARGMLARCVDPENQTVIMSTHTVSDFKPLFDNIIHISHGSVAVAASTTEIVERLAFRCSPIPPADALYVAQETGIFHSITAADTYDETDIDIHLLYQALNDKNASKVITEILNRPPSI